MHEGYLGRGHFPLSRSSSTCFRTTSWQRWRRDITAIFVIPPSSLRDLLMKENRSSVSKHVLANSSRSFLLESVSRLNKSLINFMNKNNNACKYTAKSMNR